MAKERWFDSYRMNRIRLLALYNRDREVVGAFFYQRSARPKKDDNIPAEVPMETSEVDGVIDDIG